MISDWAGAEYEEERLMISGRVSRVQGVVAGEYQAEAGGSETSTITKSLKSTAGLSG